MTGLEWTLALLVIAVGATVQASLGFGMNLVVMPLLVLIDTDLVPGPALVAAVALTACVLARERQAIEARSVSWALLGRVVGTVGGVYALSRLDDDGLQLVVAIAVLVMVGVILSPLAPPRTPATMAGAGTISGFSGSTAGIGGPPVALLFQDAPGPVVRSSMAGFFVIGSLITLTGLAIAGEFGAAELRQGFVLAPASVVGFALSGPLLPVVDRGDTRAALLTVSIASAVVIIVRLTVG